MEESERMRKLRQLLEKSPGDAFVLYAMGMEYKKGGDAKSAVEYFDQTIGSDGGYCYAYYQKGQVLESTGNVEGAREAYRQGMQAAERKGDGHAREEIAAAMGMIE